MPETLQLYVKSTSNCEGLPIQVFERLGSEWAGECLMLPFGPDREPLEVVGWTDLYNGRPCNVHVVHARWIPHKRPDISGGPDAPQEGYLVWGGNSGVRILDEQAEPTPGVDDHLPAGYGRPIVWVTETWDFPPEVQDVIERHVCAGCGAELPAATSPYWVDEGRSVWLCDDCAEIPEDAAFEEEADDGGRSMKRLIRGKAGRLVLLLRLRDAGVLEGQTFQAIGNVLGVDRSTILRDLRVLDQVEEEYRRLMARQPWLRRELTPSEFAQEISASSETVRMMIRDGLIRAHKRHHGGKGGGPAGRWYIPFAELDRFRRIAEVDRFRREDAYNQGEW